MAKKKTSSKSSGTKKPRKMTREKFDKELRKLQVELCHLQEWLKKEGLRMIVIFEGPSTLPAREG